MDFVLSLILRLLGLVMEAIAIVDTFLRGVMSRAGVDSQTQAVVLVVVAVLLIVGALRMLGGLLRILIIVFLALLLVHLLMPGMHIPDHIYV